MYEIGRWRDTAVVLSLAATVAGCGTVATTQYVMKNPRTDQVIVCRGDAPEGENFPGNAERCAQALARDGWVRLSDGPPTDGTVARPAPASSVAPSSSCGIAGEWKGNIAVHGGLLEVAMANSGLLRAHLRDERDGVAGMLDGPGFQATVNAPRYRNEFRASSWVQTWHGPVNLPLALAFQDCDTLQGEIEHSPLRLHRQR